MLKKKRKNQIIAVGALGVMALPITAAISCGSKPGGEDWYGSHRDVVVYQPNADGVNPYYGIPYRMIAPTNFIKSSLLGDGNNAQQFGLFRKTKITRDEFERTANFDTKGKKNTNIRAIAHRKTALEFEAAKKVIFYKNNTILKEFSKDSYAVPKTSTVPAHTPVDLNESINGPEFDKFINTFGDKITSIKFELRDDLGNHNWIQQTTGKKASPIVKEDFWTYIITSSMRNNKTRFKYGGTTELNSIANKKIGSDAFSKPSNTTPGAMWLNSEVSYGIDPVQFDFENPAAKKEFLCGNENAIQIKFNGKQSIRNMESFWKNIFKNSGGLKASPTFSINNAKKENQFSAADFSGDDPQSQYDEYKKSFLGKSGYLEWNAQKRNSDHYSAGKYFISNNSKKKIVFTINDDYIDSRWLKQVNKKGQKITVRNLKYSFIQPSDLSPTITQQAFQQGFAVIGAIDALSKKEYQNALSNPDKYGITYGTGYTSSNMLGDYSSLQFIPGKSNPDVLSDEGDVENGSTNFFVFYDDDYSKLMWGKSTDQLLTQFSSDSTADLYDGWADTLYSGTGLQFTSNLLAASNWYTAIKNYKLSSQESTTLFAPEGPISGDGSVPVRSVAHPTEPKEAIKALDALNIKLRSRYAMTSFDDAGVKRTVLDGFEVSRDKYVDIFTSADKNVSAVDRYGPPQIELNIIKKNIKQALDKAGFTSSDKVTFEFPIGRGNNSPQMNSFYKQLQEFINQLDSRINMVAKMNPYKEHDEKDKDGKVISSRIPKNEVAVQTITTDFTLRDTDKSWLKRIYAASTGYSIASLNAGSDYATESAASSLSNAGYLQAGALLAMSYYADKQTLISGTDNPLKGLKYAINEYKIQKNKLFTDKYLSDNFSSDGAGADDKAHKQDFIDVFKAFKFEDMYKTSIRSITDYDYIGLHGFEKLRNLARTKEGLTPGTKLYANLRKASDIFNKWLKQTMYGLDSKFHNTSSWTGWNPNTDIRQFVGGAGGELQAREMEFMIAYNIIVPGGINPIETIIGNRDYPSISISKNWYSSGGTDEQGYDDLSWVRVDDDRYPHVYDKTTSDANSIYI